MSSATGRKIYDWVLAVGLIYMFLGTDFTNDLFGGLAFGKRTNPKDGWADKYLYAVHAKNDPMMRACPEPLYGRKDKIPPFLTNMGYTNLLLAASFEVILTVALINDAINEPLGDIPNWLQFISAAFIFRGITEILYGIQLGYNNAARRIANPERTYPHSIYNASHIPDIYLEALHRHRQASVRLFPYPYDLDPLPSLWERSCEQYQYPIQRAKYSPDHLRFLRHRSH